MKKVLLFSIFLCGSVVWAQDSLTIAQQRKESRRQDSIAQIHYDSIRRGPFKTRYGFSLSPIARNVETVNGFTLGVGHFRSELIPSQTVNGINAELSPLGIGALLIWPFALPVKPQIDDMFQEEMPSTCTKVNGLNVSTGGFLEGAEMNGLNISTFTAMNRMNGMSVSPGCLVTYRMNGVSISGIVSAAGTLNGLSCALINISGNGHGIQVGGFNFSSEFKGLQVGIYNNITQKSTGLQIGLVNRTSGRCFQLGLLNINGKRALPLINW